MRLMIYESIFASGYPWVHITEALKYVECTHRAKLSWQVSIDTLTRTTHVNDYSSYYEFFKRLIVAARAAIIYFVHL